jgi:argininosuccinate lyase
MKALRKGFQQTLDPKVTSFVSSSKEDHALIEVDIKGSLAHAKMLNQCGLIDEETYKQITVGLAAIMQEFVGSENCLQECYEDVHMNVEERLRELIGEKANYLHTARSRNDQVALDLRLFIVEKTEQILELLDNLQVAIASSANKNSKAVMPGYTHLQRAQPILFAHALMAFHQMIVRDAERFSQNLPRAAVSPLGAGALVGTSLPIDPKSCAELLGLPNVFANSIDAVSDRDFILDFAYAATATGIHLSQIAETLIIWATSEFNFIKLPDSLTTASSLMPQKKNPDVLELVRAKSGTLLGNLVSVFTILKGLPQGYNRDLQETKLNAITTASVIEEALSVMVLVFEGLSIKDESMVEAASDPSLFATDIVEYLVSKGMPFRQAHGVVSVIAKQTEKPMDLFTLSELKAFCELFDEDYFSCFDPMQSANAKCSEGGTGKAQVEKAVSSALKNLALPC